MYGVKGIGLRVMVYGYRVTGLGLKVWGSKFNG